MSKVFADATPLRGIWSRFEGFWTIAPRDVEPSRVDRHRAGARPPKPLPLLAQAAWYNKARNAGGAGRF